MSCANPWDKEETLLGIWKSFCLDSTPPAQRDVNIMPMQ